MKSKKEDAVTGRTAYDCVAWYLVTTTYYIDGTTSTTEEYLGTTCGDFCHDAWGQNICDSDPGTGGGGGGEGTDINYEYAVARFVDWKVHDSLAYRTVWSEETLEGTVSSNHDLNKFTNVKHRGSHVDAILESWHPDYMVWHADPWSKSYSSNMKQATATLSGYLTLANRPNADPVTVPSKSKTFNAYPDL